MKPFDVYFPGSKDREPKFIETIEVEVENKFGEEFLTHESRQRIENIRARHMGLMSGEDIKAMRKRLDLSQKELTDLLQCGEIASPAGKTATASPLASSTPCSASSTKVFSH